MRITKPEREIEVCDRCQREGFLKTCPVCGAQFCLSCEGHVAMCWVSLGVCRACGGRKDVLALAARYAAKITPIIRARLAALEALPKEAESDG